MTRPNTLWLRKHGDQQSRYFASLFRDSCPPWLYNEMTTPDTVIIDAGCAEGDGTVLLKEWMPTVKFIGVDHNQEAIDICRSIHAGIDFQVGNIEKFEIDYSGAADWIFCSNTLEHFTMPFDILRKQLLFAAKRGVVIVVPFMETSRIASHKFTFKGMPFLIEYPPYYEAVLLHEQIVDTRKSGLWNGWQVVAVYRKP